MKRMMCSKEDIFQNTSASSSMCHVCDTEKERNDSSWLQFVHILFFPAEYLKMWKQP